MSTCKSTKKEVRNSKALGASTTVLKRRTERSPTRDMDVVLEGPIPLQAFLKLVVSSKSVKITKSQEV